MLKVTLCSEDSATLQYSGRSSVLKLIPRVIAQIRRQDFREHSSKKLIRCWKRLRCSQASTEIEGPQTCVSEQQVPGMTSFLDSLKWNRDGLVAVIVQVNAFQSSTTTNVLHRLVRGHLYIDTFVAVSLQHVDTGKVLMQAYADRAAICETLQTRQVPHQPPDDGVSPCRS